MLKSLSRAGAALALSAALLISGSAVAAQATTPATSSTTPAAAAPVHRAAAAPTPPEGCAYGTGGPNAQTMCWLQFPDFQSVTAADVNSAAANTTTNVVVEIGNYTLSFTATITPGDDGASGLLMSQLPTWPGGVLGNTIDGSPFYTGLTQPQYAFYQVESHDLTGGQYNERDTIELSDIVMLDATGHEVTSGWSMIIADAETTSNYEGFVWGSDVPLNNFEQVVPNGYEPVCTGNPSILAGELSGLGTTEVTCLGGNFGDALGGDPNPNRGALMVEAVAPTVISSTFINNFSSSRQAVAFAVMFAGVGVDKVVESRVDTNDEFTVSAFVNGEVITEATTVGGADTGTGVQPVLSGTGTVPVQFVESAGNPQTFLQMYDKQWTCTRNDVEIPASELQISDDGTTVNTTLSGTDIVQCTVTNTALVPGLSVVKTSDPESGSTVEPGDLITYEVVATNTGETPLTDVTLTDDLTEVFEHATYVTDSETSTVGDLPTVTGNTLQWIGDLAVGESVRLTYQVRVDDDVVATDTLVNAVVGEGTNPLNPENPGVPSNCVEGTEDGCTTTHTPKQHPALHVEKSADPESGSTVEPGDTITYTVVAENTGNTPLVDVTVTDDLTAVFEHATYVDGSGTSTVGDLPTVSGNTLQWIGDLAIGQSVTLTYQVTVDSDVVAVDTLVNHVVGEGTNPLNPENPGVPSNCVEGTEDGCTTTHTPEQHPSLSVVKKADPASGSTVQPGQVVTYTVVAENTGNTPLVDVTVTDTLSDVLDNASFVAGTQTATVGDAPVLAGTTLTWVGDLEVGESVTITYQVRVNENVKATDRLVNYVVAEGTNPLDPENPGVPSNCVEGTEDGCSTTHQPVPPALAQTGVEQDAAMWLAGILLIGLGGVLAARRLRVTHG